MIGKTISHYRVTAKLGAGGMGEVYLAHDERLEREVALKVLPAKTLTYEAARKRFRKEALALSKLNHPNIATIYDFDTQDGVDFLVMEYVEGTTLSEKLSGHSLPEKDVARLGGQVADALEEAHEHGVIHRDLKPGNVMVTPKGQAKVLDFGLAKLAHPVSETATTESLSATGGAVGTLPYMAPEQLRGEEADARTDIHALGLLLYEMSTGQRPFPETLGPQSIAAILQQAPRAPSEVNRQVSAGLESIILKALEKDPERRFQSAREVSANLNKMMTYSGTVVVSETSRSGELPRSWIALAGVAGLAVSLIYVARTPEEGGLRLINPVQLTSAVGVENYATWSPDGGRLAYESNQSGNWDIWVKQLGAGGPVNLTADHTGSDRYPSWSPDGRQIAFLSQRDQSWSLFTMAAVGGNPRKVVSLPIAPVYYRGAPQWSSDGAEMAVAVWDSPRNFAEIVSLQTQEKRRIALPQHGGNPCLDLSWSPDGRIFAYVTAEGDAAEVTQLWTVPFSGGEPTPVTDGRTNDRSPIWSADGRKLFFVSNQGGAMDLWQQRIGEDGKPEGKAEPVTTGLVIRSVAFSPDSTKVAYSRGRPVSNVWRLPILTDRPANWGDAKQITFDNALVEFIDVSPNGKQIAVSSDRAGNQDLWILPSEGGPMSQLTTDPTPDWCPRWSPDGKEIAFYSHRTGNRDIWVMPSGGGPARQLTHHPAEETVPTWSPDGGEIAFISRRSGNRDIWIVGAEGGEVRQVTVHPADETVTDWSRDGKWLISHSETRLLRIPAAGGEPEQIGDQPISFAFARLALDGEVLYYLGPDNLRALSLEEGGDYAVTDLVGRRGTLGWGIATDGYYLYFTWSEQTGDLWVMDVEK